MMPVMPDTSGLESIQGGDAGPSSAFLENQAANHMNFSHGAVNFGSNNGLPEWVWIGAILLGGLYVYKNFK